MSKGAISVMNEEQLRMVVKQRLAHRSHFSTEKYFEGFLASIAKRAKILGVSLESIGRLKYIVWVPDEKNRPVVWGMTNEAEQADRFIKEARKHYRPHTTGGDE